MNENQACFLSNMHSYAVYIFSTHPRILHYHAFYCEITPVTKDD